MSASGYIGRLCSKNLGRKTLKPVLFQRKVLNRKAVNRLKAVNRILIQIVHIPPADVSTPRKVTLVSLEVPVRTREWEIT